MADSQPLPDPPPAPDSQPARVPAGKSRKFDRNTLLRQIKDRLIDSTFPMFGENVPLQKFMPEGTLKELFTRQAVEKELDESYREATYKFIENKAAKVFAILVFTSKAKAILDFEKFEIHDDFLPLALEQIPERPEESRLVSKRAMQASQCVVPLGNLLEHKCDWSESENAITDFCDQQWQFLAPVLSDNTVHHRFSPKTILPFYRPKNLASGQSPSQKPSTFSVVYEAWVHPDHQKFSNPECKEGSPVAVKKMRVESLEVLVGEPYNVRDAYTSELASLELFRRIDSLHLIKSLYTFEHGDQGYYMIFPWATANLAEYWKDNNPGTGGEKLPPRVTLTGAPTATPAGAPTATPTGTRIKWVLSQLASLSDAIWRLHNNIIGSPDHLNVPAKKNGRHGDLKPDNILLMGGPEDGWLVIADVGLTKVHDTPTRYRKDQTRSMTGTQKYEPPEVLRGGPRSRAYDIWSFGCICLEFIVWVLYGPSGLKAFHDGLGTKTKFWFTRYEVRVRKAVREHNDHSETPQKWTQDLIKLADEALRDCTVTECVQGLLNDIKTKDPRCSSDTPIRDLLELTQNRLLKIEISTETNPTDSERYRADAKEMSESIRKIYEKADGYKGYLDTCLPSFPMPDVSQKTPQQQMPAKFGSSGRLGDELAAHSPRANTSPSGATFDLPGQDGGFQLVVHDGQPQSEYGGAAPLNDTWIYTRDDKFVQTLFSKITPTAVFPPFPQVSNLGKDCASLNIWEGGFSIRTSVSKLKMDQERCQLCFILFECVKKHGKEAENEVHFYRDNSTFSFSRNQEPVLSIVGHPEYFATAPASLQLGFPRLPPAKSDIEKALLREWLQVCNNFHDCWSSAKQPLPTRVLDIGDPKQQDVTFVRLIRGSVVEDERRYVALSHRWDSPTPHMTLTLQNMTSLLQGLDPRLLTQTFQDAIYVTKVLGIRYLWIDSLCIIQNSYKDWEHESSLMEAVFANAYCTIAATRAGISGPGFLQRRPDRQCVALRPVKGNPYYICDHIDDFRGNVENSALNQRGWVLQERALSHRTIYFAENQIYWECGEGIHCETLTKMRNPKAALLGDPHFPQYIVKRYKDVKINHFVSLYEQYSRRSFTFVEDRQVAILGIEHRLLQSLGTTGRYGVIQAYLHRTLLWQRAEGQDQMKLLSGIRSRNVPTWSWMAYEGSVSYMKIPYGEVKWDPELLSPFRNLKEVTTEDLGVHELELVGVGRRLVIDNGSLLERDGIVFDDNQGVHQAGLLAVVIGEEKRVGVNCSQGIYVMLVSPQTEDGKGMRYRRQGAGILQKEDFANKGRCEIRIY